jgi:nucleoside-diphosphate-sugar epimerase
VETVSADATDTQALTRAAAGASVIYNCANAPYHRWPADLPPIWRSVQHAAAANGARLVIGTNLYAYGDPGRALTSESEIAPCSRKGRVRAMLETEALEADAGGELSVTLVRASDFYGPEVTDSALGERFFGPAIAGKTASLAGRLDVPHSWVYLPDFAATMAAAGTSDDSWGRTWIVPAAPPVTGKELEAAVRARLEQGLGSARGEDFHISSMGKGALRLGGLFVPAAREMVEMYYEFDRPFVSDGSGAERLLGVTPTSLDEGLARTLEWYAMRNREQTRSAVAGAGV